MGRRGKWGMNVCFPFNVNPAQHGPKKASFVCLFAAKNLVRKSQWGDKYLSKAVQNIPGRRLVWKPLFNQEARKEYFTCIVGELVTHVSSLQRESPKEGSALCVCFQAHSGWEDFMPFTYIPLLMHLCFLFSCRWINTCDSVTTSPQKSNSGPYGHSPWAKSEVCCSCPFLSSGLFWNQWRNNNFHWAG